MNKVFVIYDSVFGNTEKVAQAIDVELGTQAIPASQVDVEQLRGLDLLMVGSPMRKFSPTAGISKLLTSLGVNHLMDMRVAIFNTRIVLEAINSKAVRFLVDKGGFATSTIARTLVKKDGVVDAPAEGFFVIGEEGSLKDSELERAADWTSRLVKR